MAESLNPLRDLPTQVWEQLQAVAAEFEAARRRDDADGATIERFLQRHAERRSELLPELLHIELELRLKSGQAARVEEYLARFPELAGATAQLVELLAAEYRCRRRHDRTVDPAEYAGRFPDLWSKLQPHLEQVAAGAETVTLAADRSAGPGGSALASRVWPQLPHYEILGVLGQGGMGVVYKARDRRLDRIVAIKMIRAASGATNEEIARFEAEARAVAKLAHPHVVQIYDVGEQDGCPFLALEYVSGGSLAEVVQRGPLSPLEAARLVEDVARAMHVAHERGIVHRDLKPGNVLLTTDGQPKVGDFGLAKQLDETQARTATGALLGTPAYMSPEQAAGRSAEISALTDVYALGAILYCLLSGRPPHQAESLAGTLELIRSQEPPSLRAQRKDVPREVETICRTALAKSPSDRYESALALANDLARWRVGEPILARGIGPVRRAWRAARRSRWKVVAALSLAMLLAVGAVAIRQYRVYAAATRMQHQIESGLAALTASAAPEQLSALDELVRRLQPLAPDAAALLAQRTTQRLETLADDLLQARQFGPREQSELARLIDLLTARRSALLAELAHRQAARLAQPHALLAVQPGEDWQTSLLEPGQVERLARREDPARIDAMMHAPPTFLLAPAGEGRDSLEVELTGAWRSASILGVSLSAQEFHHSDVLDLAFSRDDRLLASAGSDGALRFWGAENGLPVFSANLDRGPITCLTAIGAAEEFVAATAAGLVWYDAQQRQVTRVLQDLPGQPALFACADDGRSGAVVCTGDGATQCLLAIDPLSGETSGRFALPPGAQRWLSLAVSHDGGRASLGSVDRLWLIDLPRGEAIGSWPESTWQTEQVFLANGTRLLAGGSAGLHEISLPDGAETRPFLTREAGVWSVALSPDELLAAAGYDNRCIKLWDMASGGEAHTFRDLGSRAVQLTFSPTGSKLAATVREGYPRIYVYDVAARTQRYSISHGGWRFLISSAPSSADATNLRTASLGDRAASGQPVWLQIWHDDQLQGEQAQTLPRDVETLVLRAALDERRLSLQVGDLPPLEAANYARSAERGRFGLLLPPGCDVRALEAVTAPLPSGTALEQAEALYAAREFAAALAAFERTLELSSEPAQQAQLHYRRGQCLGSLYRENEAESAWRAALEVPQSQSGPPADEPWQRLACLELLARRAQTQDWPGFAALWLRLGELPGGVALAKRQAPAALCRAIVRDCVSDPENRYAFLLQSAVEVAAQAARAQQVAALTDDPVQRLRVARFSLLAAQLATDPADAREPAARLSAQCAASQYLWSEQLALLPDLLWAIRLADGLPTAQTELERFAQRGAAVERELSAAQHSAIAGERARLAAAQGDWSSVVQTLTADEGAPARGALALLLGFAYEAQGDSAAALKVWRAGRETQNSGIAQLDEIMLAGLSGTLSEDDARRLALAFVTVFGDLGPILRTLSTAGPLERAFVGVWQTERGKGFARAWALRERTFGQLLEDWIQLIVWGVMQDGAGPYAPLSEEDDVAWRTAGLVAGEMRAGRITTHDLPPLAVIWMVHHAPFKFLGPRGPQAWEALHALLAEQPELRSGAAFVCAGRMLRLDRPDDARFFVEQARADAPPESALLRCLDRLAEALPP